MKMVSGALVLSAYIFTRDGPTTSSWNQQAKLIAEDVEAGAQVGISVSLSADGTIALVGAYWKDESGVSAAGCAYIFARVSTVSTFWSQQAKLVASDLEWGAQFGVDVSLSGDGTIALVGAHLKDEGGVERAGASYLFTGPSENTGSWFQKYKLTAGNGSDLEQNAEFGHRIALSGDGRIAMIGARLKNESGSADVGAAYPICLFDQCVGNERTLQYSMEKMVANDLEEAAIFGNSVSLSNDGTVALVGAMEKDEGGLAGTGAAYIFTRESPSSQLWVEQSKLVPVDLESYANFGNSVSLSGDGTLALIGAFRYSRSMGAAYVFSRTSITSTTWTETKLLASDGGAGAFFGGDVSLSEDGNIAVIGSTVKANSGAVYVFAHDATNNGWIQQAKLVANVPEQSSNFGRGTSISYDGSAILIGSYLKDENGLLDFGAVYVFGVNNSTNLWSQQAILQPRDLSEGDLFGYSNSLSADGTVALIGAHLKDEGNMIDTGAAYIFSRQSNTSWAWVQKAKLIADDLQENDRFGVSVSLSKDGTVALVGSNKKDGEVGAAYVFFRKETTSNATTSDDTWFQLAKLTTRDGTDLKQDGTDLKQDFGYSVALSGDGSFALIGAPRKDEGGLVDTGAVYSITSFLDQSVGIDSSRFSPTTTSVPWLSVTVPMLFASTISTEITPRPTENSNPGGAAVAVVFILLLLLFLTVLAVFLLRWRRKSKMDTETTETNLVQPRKRTCRGSTRGKARATDASSSPRVRSTSKSSRRQSQSITHSGRSRQHSKSFANSGTSGTSGTSSSNTVGTLTLAGSAIVKPSYDQLPGVSDFRTVGTLTLADHADRENKPGRFDHGKEYGRPPGMVGVYDHAPVIGRYDRYDNTTGRKENSLTGKQKESCVSATGYGRSPGMAGIYEDADLIANAMAKSRPNYIELAVKWECNTCNNVNVSHFKECVSCGAARQHNMLS